MPLTQQENIFVDHLDYEAFEITSNPGGPVPATNWMTAHRVVPMDIINILKLRRDERRELIIPKPSEPYAPAWKTGEEAKERNQELAEEFRDAEAVRSERTGRTHLGEE